MKSIVLCADDYGLNPRVSEGIIELIAHQRLSATSCMTNSIYWQAAAKALKPFRNQIDIGLHFNLTEGSYLSSGHTQTALPALLTKAILKQLDFQTIVVELQHQLDAFENTLQMPPDFIDGHQHIHHFPVIREALLFVYQQRFPQHMPYIRISANSHAKKRFNHKTGLKTAAISLTGAQKLRKKLDDLQIPYNHGFSGIYNFKKANNYRHYFQQFLTEIATGGLIMCHPGLYSESYPDLLKNSRPQEWQYFMSPAFIEDCQNAKVSIGRFQNNK